MRNLVFIFLFGGGVSVFLSAPAPAKDYSVFDVIGDSTSIGVNPDFDHEHGVHYGWVEMLFGEGGGEFPLPQTNTLDTLWPGITRYNSSVKGSWGPEWGDPASTLTQAVLDHHPDIVAIQVGAIDLLVAYQGDRVFTEAERNTFRNNFRSVIDRLQANTPKPDIILVNYFDVFDGLSVERLAPDSEWRFASQWTVEGNEILQQIAREKGCWIVDIYSPMLHHCYGENLGDPLYTPPSYVRKPLNGAFEPHPNTNGHDAIYEQVYEFLEGRRYARSRPDIWVLY